MCARLPGESLGHWGLGGSSAEKRVTVTTTVWSCRQVTVMHSMQAGYLEKAQKYTDKALMQLEKLKSKTLQGWVGLYLAGCVATAPPGGWPECPLLCWLEEPRMTAALSSHHESLPRGSC